MEGRNIHRVHGYIPKRLWTSQKRYILRKRDHKIVGGRCTATDELIAAATKWNNNVYDEVLVFDQERWTKNKEPWASIQNASWDDVIIDKDKEETLTRKHLQLNRIVDRHISLCSQGDTVVTRPLGEYGHLPRLLVISKRSIFLALRIGWRL